MIPYCVIPNQQTVYFLTNFDENSGSSRDSGYLSTHCSDTTSIWSLWGCILDCSLSQLSRDNTETVNFHKNSPIECISFSVRNWLPTLYTSPRIGVREWVKKVRIWMWIIKIEVWWFTRRWSGSWQFMSMNIWKGGCESQPYCLEN